MTPAAALAAAYPGAEVYPDLAGTYARAELPDRLVSVAVGRDSVVAVLHLRAGGRQTLAGYAVGATAEEALQALGVVVSAPPVAMRRAA